MNNPAEVLVATPTGPGSLAFGGFWGGFVTPILGPSLEPTFRLLAAPLVQDGLNNVILGEAAARSPGGVLPPGATVSMGRLVITPSGARLTVAIGQFG
jgi:hypothetical protein